MGAQPYVRSHTIANEDVRDQALYVTAHAAPHDVIVVSLASNWGFAYYWPTGQPARRVTTADMQQYVAYFPDQPRIVVASARDVAGVDTALSQALARVRQHRCARIWLVRTHLAHGEGPHGPRHCVGRATVQHQGGARRPERYPGRRVFVSVSRTPVN